MNTPIKLKLILLGRRHWSFRLRSSIPGWSQGRDTCFGSEFFHWEDREEHLGMNRAVVGENFEPESLTASILCTSCDPKNKRPVYQVILVRSRPLYLYGFNVDQFTVVIPERGHQSYKNEAEKCINTHVKLLLK